MPKSKRKKHGQTLSQEQKHHIKHKAADAKKDANAKLAVAAAAAHAVAAAAHAVAPEPEPIADVAFAPEPVVDVAEPVVAPEPFVNADVHVNAPIDALPRKKRRQLFKTHSLETKNVSSHMSNRNIARDANDARAARDANVARAARAAQYKWNPNNNTLHPFEKKVTKKYKDINEFFNNYNSEVALGAPLPAEPFVADEAGEAVVPRRRRNRRKFKNNIIKTDNKWNPLTGTMFNNVSNPAEPNVVTEAEAEADVETKSVIVPDTKANTITKYKTYLSKVGPKSRTLGPRETILFENDNIDEGLLSEEDKEMREQLRTTRLPNNNINKIRKNAVRLRGLERIEYENQKRSPITRRLLSLVGKSKNKTTKRFLNEEMIQAAYNSNNSLKKAMLAKNPNFVYQPNRMSNRLTKRAINNADREETKRIYEEEQQKIEKKRAEIAEKQRKRENNIKKEKESFKAAKEATKAAEMERVKSAKAKEIERIKAAKAEEIERIRATKAAKAAEIQSIKEAQAHNEERRKLTLKAENNLWKTRKSDEDRLRESERQELAAALAEKEKIAPGRWTRFKTGLKKIFTKKNNNKK